MPEFVERDQAERPVRRVLAEASEQQAGPGGAEGRAAADRGATRRGRAGSHDGARAGGRDLLPGLFVCGSEVTDVLSFYGRTNIMELLNDYFLCKYLLNISIAKY